MAEEEMETSSRSSVLPIVLGVVAVAVLGIGAYIYLTPSSISNPSTGPPNPNTGPNPGPGQVPKTYTPKIAISPSSISYVTNALFGPSYSTTTFTVSGSGFAPSDSITVSNSNGGRMNSNTITSASDGTFSQSFAFTSGILGPSASTIAQLYSTITASGSLSGTTTGTITFVNNTGTSSGNPGSGNNPTPTPGTPTSLTPNISVNSNVYTPGDTLYVTGSGFSLSKYVRVTRLVTTTSSSYSLDVQTGPRGDFGVLGFGSAAIPTAGCSGNLSITATDITTGAIATALITQTSGGGGTPPPALRQTVAVGGYNFYTNSSGSLPSNGTVSNPYVTAQGWQSSGFYLWPSKSYESTASVPDAATLNSMNQALFGTNITGYVPPNAQISVTPTSFTPANGATLTITATGLTNTPYNVYADTIQLGTISAASPTLVCTYLTPSQSPLYLAVRTANIQGQNFMDVFAANGNTPVGNTVTVYLG